MSNPFLSKKNRSAPSGTSSQRWLSSYAVFMQLLFALFVVLYTLAKADLKKSPDVPAETRKKSAQQRPETPESGELQVDAEFGEIHDLIEDLVSAELGVANTAPYLQMKKSPQGLNVRITLKDLFAAGDSKIREDYRPLIEKIGKALVASKKTIRVEGFADPSEEVPSLWDLSALRASGVVRLWQSKGIEPGRLLAVGRGSTHPISDGQTDLDRGKNRRLELWIEALPLVKE